MSKPRRVNITREVEVQTPWSSSREKREKWCVVRIKGALHEIENRGQIFKNFK